HIEIVRLTPKGFAPLQHVHSVLDLTGIPLVVSPLYEKFAVRLRGLLIGFPWWHSEIAVERPLCRRDFVVDIFHDGPDMTLPSENPSGVSPIVKALSRRIET